MQCAWLEVRSARAAARLTMYTTGRTSSARLLWSCSTWQAASPGLCRSPPCAQAGPDSRWEAWRFPRAWWGVLRGPTRTAPKP